MSLQINLEVQDLNTILEGLARVQENAMRVQSIVRDQANVQLEAKQKAQAQAEEASGPEPQA